MLAVHELEPKLRLLFSLSRPETSRTDETSEAKACWVSDASALARTWDLWSVHQLGPQHLLACGADGPCPRSDYGHAFMQESCNTAKH